MFRSLLFILLKTLILEAIPHTYLSFLLIKESIKSGPEQFPLNIQMSFPCLLAVANWGFFFLAKLVSVLYLLFPYFYPYCLDNFRRPFRVVILDRVLTYWFFWMFSRWLNQYIRTCKKYKKKHVHWVKRQRRKDRHDHGHLTQKYLPVFYCSITFTYT